MGSYNGIKMGLDCYSRESCSTDIRIIETPLFDQDREPSEEGNSTSKKFVQSVYFCHLDILALIFYPSFLKLYSGIPISLRSIENQLKEQPETYSEKFSKRNRRILCTWYPREDRERELIQSVGGFTCGSAADDSAYLFLGSELGCVVVFSITAPEKDLYSDYCCETLINKTSDDLTTDVSLKPFLWSNVAALIDFPKDLCDMQDPFIKSLNVSPTIISNSSYAVVALVSHNYLAVLEFEPHTGLTPVDVVNLPSSVDRVLVALSGPPLEDSWTLNIAVYSAERIFLLQATPTHVVLISTLELQDLLIDFFSEQELVKEIETKPYLLELAFSSCSHPRSELYLGFVSQGKFGSNTFHFVIFDFFSHCLTKETMTLPDVASGLIFMISTSPCLKFFENGKTLALYDSCICIATQKSIELLSIPFLKTFNRVNLGPNKDLLIQFESHQQLNWSNEEHVDTLPQHQSTSHPSHFISPIHVCSTLPSQSLLNQTLRNVEINKLSTLDMDYSLAFFVMKSSCSSDFYGLWLRRRKRYVFQNTSLRQSLTASPLFEGSGHLYETISQLKERMEIRVEKAIKNLSEVLFSPASVLEEFQTLLRLYKLLNDDTQSLDHALVYIADLAKMTPFRTFDELRRFLMGTLDLILEAERFGSFSIKDLPRVSLALEKFLHKLMTYNLLRLVDKSYSSSAMNCNQYYEPQEIGSFGVSISASQDEQSIGENASLHNEEMSERSISRTIFSNNLVENDMTCFNDTFNWSSWNHFAIGDITKLCCDFAGSGEIVKLCIVFNRHFHDLDSTANKRSDKIMRILQNIPIKLGSCHLEELLGQWIQQQVIKLLHDNKDFLDWLISRALALEVVWKSPLVPLKLLSCVFPESLGTLFSESMDIASSFKTALQAVDSVDFACHTNDPLAYHFLTSFPGLSFPLLPKSFVSLSMFWSGSGSVVGNLSSTTFPIASPHSEDHTSHLYRLFRIYCLLLECAYIQIRHELVVSFSALERGEIGWIDIAYVFLNRVRLPELLGDEVRLHLKPFCDSHCLNMEELLMSYIDDVISEIDEDLLASTEINALTGVREREARVVALLNCLEMDQSKAQCLSWLLHAWSPTSSLASLESLGVISLLQSLKKSRSLAGSPILQELQSTIVLRELQGLLSKYSLSTSISVLTNPNDATLLITHLACFNTWRTTSFSDALTAAHLLRPYIGSSMNPVRVAVLRLETLASVSNRKLFNLVLYGLKSRVFHAGGLSSQGIIWTWKGYEDWENSWRLSFLQEIEETVLSKLSPEEIVQSTKQFTSYILSLLEYAAETLSEVDASPNGHFTIDHLMTAAEAIVGTVTALFLEQRVTTIFLQLKSKTSRPTSVGSTAPHHVTPWSKRDTGSSCLNFEYLQSCERLRREFGVFVKPSDLTLGSPQTAIQEILFMGVGNRVLEELHQKNRTLMARWNLTQQTASLKRTRSLFLSLGHRSIEEIVQNSIHRLASEKNRTQGRDGGENGTHQISTIDSSISYGSSRVVKQNESYFTRLLQFGALMGVGESYVRHQCIVRPLTYEGSQIETLFLEKLLADIERNSSPQNSYDILCILKNVLNALYRYAQDIRKSMDVLVCLSQIFHVGSRCLYSLPSTELQNGIRLVSDVLTSLQLLAQSDLLDTVADSIGEISLATQFSDSSPQHLVNPQWTSTHFESLNKFSFLAKLFVPSFSKDSLLAEVQANPFALERKVENAQYNASQNRSRSSTLSGLFSARFSHLAALYKKDEALSDALRFLVLRHSHVSDKPLDESNIESVREAITAIIRKLLDLESYELALIFLLKFPEPNVSFTLIKQTATQLLSKVIFSRDSFDFELGVGLSLLLGRNEMWNKFLHILPTIHDVSRVLFYSRLVVDVGFLMQTSKLVKNAHQIWIRAKWRKQLDELGCLYDVKRFQEVQEQPGMMSNAYQRELLPHFISISNFDLSLARQFALDFNIEESELLCCWLKLVLVHLPLIHSREKYEATSSFSKSTLNTKLLDDFENPLHNELTLLSASSLESTSFLHQSYRQLMYPVLYSLPLEKVEEIFEKECLPHISPYDYESLELLLSFIKHKPVARASLTVLRHINSYIRSDSPSKEELENWGKPRLFLMSPLEKKLQTQRLPFHALMERPWKVLGPLISDSTVNTFMPLYSLKLRRDDFQLQLFWNFVEDIRQTQGNILGFLRGSRWTFSNIQYPNSTTSGSRCFFLNSRELLTVEMKLKQMCESCYAVNSDRALAACLLLLEKPNLLPLGQLQVAIAEWTASKIAAPSLSRDSSHERDQIFSVALHQALPPFIADELHTTLHHMGYSISNSDASCPDKKWILSRTVEQAAREAGALRSKWTLLECGLGIFVDLLPECVLLCIHALYYYLAPILMRPSFIGLHNPEQLHVYMHLSQHPFLQQTSHGLRNELQHNYIVGHSAMNDELNELQSVKSYSFKKSRSLHSLVDVICLGCNLNPRTARLLLLRRLIKAPFWTPLYVVSLLERNIAIYKTQDILAMIGCVPSIEMLAQMKSVLHMIEQSPLTEGFREKWFIPFNVVGGEWTCYADRQKKSTLTFGQSLFETMALRRQYLMVLGMDPKSFIRLALEIALKNERTLSTTSRALTLLYCAETTERIHSIYKEPATQIVEFWKHSLYLDALDCLGIASQLGSFIKTDKTGLVRAFWRQSRNLPLDTLQGDNLYQQIYLLILIVSLSLDFHAHDFRLLCGVLARLLNAVRLFTIQRCELLSGSSVVLQERATQSIFSHSVEALPLGGFLFSILCSLFQHNYKDSCDKEFVQILDTLLQAPVVDSLNLLKRLMSGAFTHAFNQHNIVDLIPTIQWFFVTPALLKQSSFLHLHQISEISFKYFDLANFFNSIIISASLQTNPELYHNLIRTDTVFPSQGTTSQLTNHSWPQFSGDVYSTLLIFLQSFYEFSCSHQLNINNLIKTFHLKWLFEEEHPNQSELNNIYQHNMSDHSSLFMLLLRLEIICVALGYQCLSNSFETVTKSIQHFKTVADQYIEVLPVFLLLLTSFSDNHQRNYQQLIDCFAETIVRSPPLCDLASLLISLMQSNTQKIYLNTLNDTAQRLGVSLHL